MFDIKIIATDKRFYFRLNSKQLYKAAQLKKNTYKGIHRCRRLAVCLSPIVSIVLSVILVIGIHVLA